MRDVGSLSWSILSLHAYACSTKAGLHDSHSMYGMQWHPSMLSCMQEGVEAPIHIMLQPDYLTSRVAALEDLEIYVEDLAFAKILCEETRAVKRTHSMKVIFVPLIPVYLQIAMHSAAYQCELPHRRMSGCEMLHFSV